MLGKQILQPQNYTFEWSVSIAYEASTKCTLNYSIPHMYVTNVLIMAFK